MKIAFVVNNFPPKTGGVEQHVSALSTELQKLGHQVIIITLSGQPSVDVEQGMKVYRLKEYFTVDGILGFPSPAGFLKIFRILKNENVDVISVHTRFFSMSWFGVLFGRLLRTPVIQTEHGSGFVLSEKAIIRLASRLIDRTLGKMILRGASKVVGVSQPSCEFVQDISGVPAEVFYNVSPLPITRPDIVL